MTMDGFERLHLVLSPHRRPVGAGGAR